MRLWEARTLTEMGFVCIPLLPSPQEMFTTTNFRDKSLCVLRSGCICSVTLADLSSGDVAAYDTRFSATKAVATCLHLF